MINIVILILCKRSHSRICQRYRLGVVLMGDKLSIRDEPIIVAKDLTISYELHRERKKLTALQDINLEVKAGEFVVLVGPSGCGKQVSLMLSQVWYLKKWVV